MYALRKHNGGSMSDAAWPELEWSHWSETADTLHMWTQIVGKTRLALTPLQNHWWNVPLYVTARGLSTSAMACAVRRSFDRSRSQSTHPAIPHT